MSQMTEEDKKDLSKKIAYLYSYYHNSHIEDSVLVLYIKSLSSYDIRDIDSAINRIIRTEKFMPKIATFVEIIEGSEESKASQSWERLKKAARKKGAYYDLRVEDSRVYQALKSIGGWGAFCEMSHTEEPFKKREFVQNFQGASEVNSLKSETLVFTGYINANRIRNNKEPDQEKMITFSREKSGPHKNLGVQ
jgi:hypothetical protein